MQWKRRHCFLHIATFAFLLFLLAVLNFLVPHIWHPSFTELLSWRDSSGLLKGEGLNANKSSVENNTISPGKQNISTEGQTGLENLNAISMHGLFPYIINEPDKCQKRKAAPFLVFIIATEALDVEARSAIRQTWANESLVSAVGVIRLFLLGKREGQGVTQRMLQEESRTYHDIIQQDFLDSYYNLTLKTLMGLHWVARYCPHAAYVMKTDSDMFINTEYLIEKLLRPGLKTRTNYYTGRIMENMSPIRDKKNKWYMSEEEYQNPKYPTFCSGTGYVLSADLADKIYRISTRIHRLHLEDVYVGLCLSQLRVKPTEPPSKSLFHHWHVPFTGCKYTHLITSHQIPPKTILKYWKTHQSNKEKCKIF
ncbi:beta-1,3-galactosyltransferase 2 [Dunckerocampus dactyliophorus]|uniref:beta-1,3-galactosyltransferase 2 n=1 Tax=Dunckerocampus dactyliophorus TaxID=161453 RepID=UPI00240681EB|nr:beta-1,3-galactosyltransferase 2 [Dunckerocampus dactyliophorus]XP_054609052.1 beta-1,3-galactosyltransferase 2 [Dunckerocampus dactyliophorus]XP_054609061.1 beta-1,3-galactosyltransferase 2 [Dunckerocampus dactyliophorus]XP_054609070.1 beta-1,3-galactosyltransferase 2 [Dunckerocampus dactyliophorus]XP_054609078.1 beta-1,3-galactosyltransferase 2 [Dunckerocampus dactyliophorus]XP_054609086.1 beta-1,3-galactosyltransferase 2 [Dunckerocampus dactyliophorus]XP_054609094.1 beta-1,3-galactosylt